MDKPYRENQDNVYNISSSADRSTSSQVSQPLLYEDIDQSDLTQGLCFHRKFEEQVKLTPHAVAVISDGKHYTFEKLNHCANQLAHLLHKNSIHAEVPVGIYMRRSFLLAVAVLGVLKAGGVCVPLDEEIPLERISFIIEDTLLKLFLTESALVAAISVHSVEFFCLDMEQEALSQESSGAYEHDIPSSHPAFIFYTSGSTGTPKGVVISHGGGCSGQLSEQLPYPLLPNDRFFLTTSPSSCRLIGELFWPWLSGACVVIALPERHRESNYTIHEIMLQHITIVNFVPSNLRLILEEPDWQQCHHLRMVLSLGEPLPVDVLERFILSLPGTHLVNSYAQTEVFPALFWQCEAVHGYATVPAGYPTKNTQVYILDGLMQSLPPGEWGDIYIGGPHLASGYLHHPELTAEKFRPNPFASSEGERFCRTGDIGRYLPSGCIEISGRADRLIKIRGRRIEPEEIEVHLLQHPSIRQALVIKRDDQSLAAYIIPQSVFTANIFHELRSLLLIKLPEYMIPSVFIPLTSFPLTIAGKIDIQALSASLQEGRSLECAYVVPITYMEKVVVEIWTEILKKEPIGTQDNFLELGGHSLSAMQIVSRLRNRFNVSLPLQMFFSDNANIATIASLIEEMLTVQTENIPFLEHMGTVAEETTAHLGGESYPLAFTQQGLWILDQMEEGFSAFNISGALRIKGALNIPLLERCLNTIINRHESLRTSFSRNSPIPLQFVRKQSTIKIPITELNVFSYNEQKLKILCSIQEEAQQPLELAEGSLIKALLLRLNTQEHVLIITIHHIIADGWSWSILLKELSILYDAYIENKHAIVPQLNVQYKDFVFWQRQYLQGETLTSLLAYWKKQLKDVPEVLHIPTDFPRPTLRTYKGARESKILSSFLSKQLAKLCRQENTTLFMTLLAAFYVLLFRYSQQEDIVVGVPISGRNAAEFENLIGCFVNTLLLRVSLTETSTFRAVLQQTRQVTLEASQHELPFEIIVNQLHPSRNLSQNPVFQITFNMLSFFKDIPSSKHLHLETLLTPEPGAKYDLSMYVVEYDDSIHCDLVYDKNLFLPSRISEMLAQFELLLEQVVKKPDQTITTYDLRTERARSLLPSPEEPLASTWYGSLQEKVALWARLFPDHPALVEQDQVWTYSQLVLLSDQVTYLLQTNGIQKQEVVAIHAQRYASLVWILLGIIKAGALFLILDAAYPPSRLISSIEDAQPKGWIQMKGPENDDLPQELSAFVKRFPFSCRLTFVHNSIEQQAKEGKKHAEGNTDIPSIHRVNPEDRAYIAFTSGSTGKPKGIVGSQRPLSHFLHWYSHTFSFSKEDNFALLSGLSHDPLLRDIFTPLWIGATLYIPNPGEMFNPSYLVQWLKQNAINNIHITPAWSQILRTGAIEQRITLDSLHYIILGGDLLTTHDLSPFKTLAPHAICVNFYGATETPQAMSYFVVPSQILQQAQSDRDTKRKIPIGRGINNVQLLLFHHQMKQAGINEIGEIYIRTPYLALEYLNDRELTQKHFVRNPFSQLQTDRLYKTGDLARYLPDGTVEILGRVDRQIKIHGFRIEPTEIETVFYRYSGIKDVTVLPVVTHQGTPQLVAYIICQTPQLEISTEDLQNFLQSQLPSYMIPATILRLSAFPLTAQGKIDRNALVKLDLNTLEKRTPTLSLNLFEQKLVSIFSELLELEDISIHDNLFEIGADSLICIQAIALARQAGIPLVLKHLVKYQTISQVSIAFQEQLASSENSKFSTSHWFQEKKIEGHIQAQCES